MKDLVADSTFYLCFLDDIDSPEDLVSIINNFKIHLSPIVYFELKKSKNFEKISKHRNINLFAIADFNIGELVKPFFSRSEINRGEHELIVVAYFAYNLNQNLILIIDEISIRNFIVKNLTYLEPFMTGTVGMIGKCFYTFNIFNKEKSLELLNKIENSKFRVNKGIIDNVRKMILAA